MENERKSVVFLSDGKIDMMDYMKIREVCKNLNLMLFVEKNLFGFFQTFFRLNPSFVLLNGNCNISKNLASINDFCAKSRVIVLKNEENEENSINFAEKNENFCGMFNNSFASEKEKSIDSEQNVSDLLTTKNCANKTKNFSTNEGENEEYCSLFVQTDIDNLKQCIQSFYTYCEKKTPKKADLKQKIREYLLDFKFDPTSKGFFYLVECIHYRIENRMKNRFLVGSCLKEFSQKYNTKPTNIDRNIRSEIRKTFKFFKEIWCQNLNFTFKSKPTVKNFITFCADNFQHKFLK